MDERPTHLDLFSGIGGFALAAQWAGFRTIGFCEIDKYCQRVIAKNFLADARYCLGNSSRNGGNQRWPRASAASGESIITGDIRDLDGEKQFLGVDLITGGFPCQPFSCAGKRKGKADDRHLWPEMLRVIAEARPAWVLGENVAGIIGMELDTVLFDLETIGYACRPFVIPACGVDARHRRNRVWIVAHDSRIQQGRKEQRTERKRTWARGESIDVVEPNGARLKHAQEVYARCGEFREGQSDNRTACGASRWLPEPDVGRVAHGIPARVDRLRGLGNAIVPQVAYQILKAIREQIG